VSHGPKPISQQPEMETLMQTYWDTKNSATPSPKHFQLPVKSQLDFGVQSELLAGSILPLKNYNFLLNYELFPLESPCSQLNQVEPP